MSERLDVDTVMKVGMRGFKDETPYNWHGKMIKIRYMLSRDEEIELIQSIIRCFSVDDVYGGCVPEFVDLATRANIVAAYALVELPGTIEEQHRLLYHSDLYDVVLRMANKAQIDSILAAVKEYM